MCISTQSDCETLAINFIVHCFNVYHPSINSEWYIYYVVLRLAVAHHSYYLSGTIIPLCKLQESRHNLSSFCPSNIEEKKTKIFHSPQSILLVHQINIQISSPDGKSQCRAMRVATEEQLPPQIRKQEDENIGIQPEGILMRK